MQTKTELTWKEKKAIAQKVAMRLEGFNTFLVYQPAVSKHTYKELLEMYYETGVLLWKNGSKSEVEFKPINQL